MLQPIAFIGFGNMGRHMVQHLLAAGHPLTVYARRAETLQAAQAMGAKTATTPAEAARGADVIMTNVTTTADVEAVLLGSAGVIETASAGAVVCDFSTIDAEATRRMAATLADKGIGYLDCPVSGGVQAAQAATLTIMVGGAADDVQKARPLLEKLGKQIFHMGPVGSGQITKACNQTVQVITIQAIAEAMLMARANGVDLHRVVEALMSGFAGSKMLGLMGPKMADRNFAAGIEARLHHKDFGLIRDLAQAQNLPMPAARLVHQQLEKLMLQGFGRDDTSNLLRVLEAEYGRQHHFIPDSKVNESTTGGLPHS